MLKIRLKRIGRIKQPFYRIVVADVRRSPQSISKEILGSFNPRNKKGSLVLKEERIKYWLSQGAQVSGVVHNIFIKAGIITGGKKKVTKVHKKKKEETQVGVAKEVKKEEPKS